MRIGAAIVALVAIVSLAAQAVVSAGLMPEAGPLAVLWRMLGYFTVLANIAVAIVLANAALTGRIGSGAAGAVTVTMAVVGLTYHTLLAGIWAPQGLAWWADQGLHTAVPVLTLAWWLWPAPKAGLTAQHALLWLAFPMAYAAYALFRGAATGFWPYPFVDVAALGWTRVAVNVVAMGAGFVALGLALVALARRLAR